MFEEELITSEMKMTNARAALTYLLMQEVLRRSSEDFTSEPVPSGEDNFLEGFDADEIIVMCDAYLEISPEERTEEDKSIDEYVLEIKEQYKKSEKLTEPAKYKRR